MANIPSLGSSLVFLVVFFATLSAVCDADDEERKIHIVYMGALPEGEYSLSSQHFSFDGVVSVFPSKTLHPQTTRSWDFMGFSENVHRNPTIESNVIVGVIDTGIWPESESFNSEGFGPPPKKWKGKCKGGQNFTCNNKIIGARYYTSDVSARDIMGHGTHTASIAAGNLVKQASFYGLAQGTARGGVPSARIAAYKVCHPDIGCRETDILAAFDDAIADGVDIITVSLGVQFVTDLTYDSIAIGAFHAMERGILTTHSAGNAFHAGTVVSVAPWMLTVAASSTDRQIIDKVVLGDGRTLVGNAVNQFKVNGTKHPLIYGSDVTKTCDEFSAQLCSEGCLDSGLVKGKIVLCNDAKGIKEVHRAGAFGAIAQSGELTDVSIIVPLPASVLSAKDIDLVQRYMNSSKMPRARISRSEPVRNFSAPFVPSFSSRGPNTIIPEILKPDIAAPGVEILAAYSPAASPSEDPLDKRSIKYNILSGTSMSCPHAAGAAAYVKSLHPEWSPSVIKSALMTTAWRMNATKNPDAEFAYGAGHIDPVKASKPGLVYESMKEDYVKMLCNMKYDESKLRKIYGDNTICPKGTKGAPKDLNYPSMAVRVAGATPFTVQFPRTVTNVGLANSTYKATIIKNSHLRVIVKPSIISFKSLNEKKSFVVFVNGKVSDSLESAALVWSDGTHSVRSPIVVFTDIFSGV
ncbi:unnamed protein product [Ilex paraguariensis]|uniref:Cucumisin n=1 Tax=Ilex paraguariensis TaxID=185542 RepID=A0ABC8QWH3_9AQUA